MVYNIGLNFIRKVILVPTTISPFIKYFLPEFSYLVNYISNSIITIQILCSLVLLATWYSAWIKLPSVSDLARLE